MQPLTLTFGKFLTQIEDPANPGVFVAYCGFTERSLELKAETATDQIPDCDDNDAPAWNATGIKALSATVSGQGVCSLAAHAQWRTWMLNAQSRNIRVVFATPEANGGGYYQGSAVLTSLKFDGTFGEKTKQTVNLESDGPWTWVDATA